MRYESLTQPLGSKGGFGPAVFEPLNKSRTRRIKHREDNEVFNVNDYPLAGKEDKDLRHFANEGFIVSVQDSDNDTEEEGGTS